MTLRSAALLVVNRISRPQLLLKEYPASFPQNFKSEPKPCSIPTTPKHPHSAPDKEETEKKTQGKQTNHCGRHVLSEVVKHSTHVNNFVPNSEFME